MISLPTLPPLAGLLLLSGPISDPSGPEQRAVSYLAEEVPRWRSANGCASCHHNGDGAHALFRAIALGVPVPEAALSDSVAWLREPASWDDNGGNGAFSDKRLARIQFARALSAGIEAGRIRNRSALQASADRIASDQQPDGSWPLDGPDTLGSPTTYGWSLASLSALEVLRNADPDRYRTEIDRATSWLRSRPIRTVLDASVELLRPDDPGSPTVSQRRSQAIALLRRSQADDGGWGPFATSPPEVFDTAIAVLALCETDSEEARRMALRGRSFLLSSQLDSGGWPETTRPSGNQSDAQHTSTSAWATLALLATRGIEEPDAADLPPAITPDQNPRTADPPTP
ncbi:prenyltransferase/squalene oxidase repeat-containing protein [Tautonia sociabilis]|uniref:Squalene cyclase C-terminal domain-containing protein n=1 Tax=Tautonia sociabilis TaxID=2080755 RepID=A0A432MH25_9BACT|nr:prenyltransferase/squalene oxidase repeat-containing protein [Tautonia sociabilis]RUL86136.1 hypothetical protein TsocGM_17140 [Tautonia sociabilis]